jgi:uncharacterized membrane protein YeiH
MFKKNPGAALHQAGDLPADIVLRAALAGAALCFTLRMLALRCGWRLPRAWRTESSGAGAKADLGIR